MLDLVLLNMKKRKERKSAAKKLKLGKLEIYQMHTWRLVFFYCIINFSLFPIRINFSAYSHRQF